MAGGISVRRMSADRMPTSRGITRLADIPDGERRDGGPELVIRGEHPVIAMPVLPRRRHEIGQPVQEVKRRARGDGHIPTVKRNYVLVALQSKNRSFWGKRAGREAPSCPLEIL